MTDKDSHVCKELSNTKWGGYGVAVNYIQKDDENQCWTMGNGEYQSYPIVACPFCGVKLDMGELKGEARNEGIIVPTLFVLLVGI